MTQALSTIPQNGAAHRGLRAEIHAMSKDQKWERLRQVMQRSAVDFFEMSVCVDELIEDGVGADEIKVEWIDTLRRVAAGQTLPEVMATFRSSLVEQVGALPIKDQQRIVDGVPLKLVIRTGSGVDHRMVDFVNATKDQRRQLLDNKRHHLRTEAEQIVYLEGQRRALKTAALSRVGICDIDPVARIAYATKKGPITVADLRAILKALGG